MFRHRELAAKIAALTENLEELRSEKNLLLATLEYTEKDAATKFPKDIAAMEQSLKQLEEQEQKYSAELGAALTDYARLGEQAHCFDPVPLHSASALARIRKRRIRAPGRVENGTKGSRHLTRKNAKRGNGNMVCRSLSVLHYNGGP